MFLNSIIVPIPIKAMTVNALNENFEHTQLYGMEPDGWDNKYV